MKTSLLTIISGLILLTACNKEASKSSTGNRPLLISVVNASEFMQVSETSLRSNESLVVHFNQNGDSIIWWVTGPGSSNLDSSGYPRDTTVWIPPVIPPVDSTLYPNPIDSTFNPGGPVRYPSDSSGTYPGSPTLPPTDSTIADPGGSPPPSDTLHSPPIVQVHTQAGYDYSRNKSNFSIKIQNAGSYQISAGAYHKNPNGSYSLLKTGYIRLIAK